ncbi:hypothetical protein [Diaminobutyricimonas sp. LJ205]|uniref:hypothetical protein n=1 Tax=Diaminobutyricimonas sp. LJ205 TaxID=2683590 RepID=UPI0012F4B8A6|nr:hypothetical protein [Diaminobutyricimonas sp. LJ205]
MKNRRFSGAAAVAASVTPRRAFWMGVVLVISSATLQVGLLPALFAIGGQELAATDLAWAIMTACSTVVLPLGAALVVLSFVGGALEAVPAAVADPDDPAWPKRLSPRAAAWTGCTFVVLGLALRTALPGWQMATAAPSDSLLPHVLAYVVYPIAVVLVPIGILLMPAAWVLSMIESRRAAAARVD